MQDKQYKNDTTEADQAGHANTQVTKKPGVGVSASPLNAVKLELALIFVLGVSITLIIFQYVDNELLQFILLAGYGLFTSAWIIVRTRILLKKHLADSINR